MPLCFCLTYIPVEHGTRDRFISASMTAHQLRLPGATQAGSQSYGPPFRGPEDGIQPRMYASPSSVLNPPRYVQQALRSASGELLGWKTYGHGKMNKLYSFVTSFIVCIRNILE